MAETELDILRREVAQLRRELHELRAATRPTPPSVGIDREASTTVTGERPIDDEPRLSRRHALRTAGVIATGAVVGGLTTIATAGPAAATPGSFSGDPVALRGDATTGIGVVATSVSGPALSASTSANTDAAIDVLNPNHYGISSNGTIGVVGQAVAGGSAGVMGTAVLTNTGSGGSFSGPIGATIDGELVTAQLLPTVGGPPSGINRTYYQGALVVDNAGALWYCVTSGAPGTWRQVSSANSAGTYHPVTPGRVYDSRCPAPSPGPIQTGGVRLLSVAAQRDLETGAVIDPNFVPANATAVFANVAVVDTVASGFLTINPGGITTIGASTINWGTGGQIQANGVSLTLDNARQITVVVGGPGSTDFLIDIFGYWL